MTKRTRRVLLAPLAALFLMASAAMPASNEAEARTATCSETISSSQGTGTLTGSYCPIQVSCCSFGAIEFSIISCEVCECGYLISGSNGSSYFTRDVQWSCWLF